MSWAYPSFEILSASGDPYYASTSKITICRPNLPTSLSTLSWLKLNTTIVTITLFGEALDFSQDFIITDFTFSSNLQTNDTINLTLSDYANFVFKSALLPYWEGLQWQYLPAPIEDAPTIHLPTWFHPADPNLFIVEKLGPIGARDDVESVEYTIWNGSTLRYYNPWRNCLYASGGKLIGMEESTSVGSKIDEIGGTGSDYAKIYKMFSDAGGIYGIVGADISQASYTDYPDVKEPSMIYWYTEEGMAEGQHARLTGNEVKHFIRPDLYQKREILSSSILFARCPKQYDFDDTDYGAWIHAQCIGACYPEFSDHKKWKISDFASLDLKYHEYVGVDYDLLIDREKIFSCAVDAGEYITRIIEEHLEGNNVYNFNTDKAGWLNASYHESELINQPYFLPNKSKISYQFISDTESTDTTNYIQGSLLIFKYNGPKLDRVIYPEAEEYTTPGHWNPHFVYKIDLGDEVVLEAGWYGFMIIGQELIRSKYCHPIDPNWGSGSGFMAERKNKVQQYKLIIEPLSIIPFDQQIIPVEDGKHLFIYTGAWQESYASLLQEQYSPDQQINRSLARLYYHDPTGTLSNDEIGDYIRENYLRVELIDPHSVKMTGVDKVWTTYTWLPRLNRRYYADTFGGTPKTGGFWAASCPAGVEDDFTGIVLMNWNKNSGDWNHTDSDGFALLEADFWPKITKTFSGYYVDAVGNPMTAQQYYSLFRNGRNNYKVSGIGECRDGGLIIGVQHQVLGNYEHPAEVRRVTFYYDTVGDDGYAGTSFCPRKGAIKVKGDVTDDFAEGVDFLICVPPYKRYYTQDSITTSPDREGVTFPIRHRVVESTYDQETNRTWIICDPPTDYFAIDDQDLIPTSSVITMCRDFWDSDADNELLWTPDTDDSINDFVMKPTMFIPKEETFWRSELWYVSPEEVARISQPGFVGKAIYTLVATATFEEELTGLETSYEEGIVFIDLNSKYSDSLVVEVDGKIYSSTKYNIINNNDGTKKICFAESLQNVSLTYNVFSDIPYQPEPFDFYSPGYALSPINFTVFQNGAWYRDAGIDAITELYPGNNYTMIRSRISDTSLDADGYPTTLVDVNGRSLIFSALDRPMFPVVVPQDVDETTKQSLVLKWADELLSIYKNGSIVNIGFQTSLDPLKSANILDARFVISPQEKFNLKVEANDISKELYPFASAEETVIDISNYFINRQEVDLIAYYTYLQKIKSLPTIDIDYVGDNDDYDLLFSQGSIIKIPMAALNIDNFIYNTYTFVVDGPYLLCIPYKIVPNFDAGYYTISAMLIPQEIT